MKRPVVDRLWSWSCALLLGALPAAADEPIAPPPRKLETAPLYGPAEVLPVDLATALRLVDRNNPLVGLARARVREAMAREDEARVQLLPTLSGGAAYYRHDGQTQNQRGEVFGVSRSNLFSGGGAALRVELADALFLPLVARQLTRAEAAGAQAVSNNTQLEVASAYLDLLAVHALLAINADTLARAEQMAKYARVALQSGLAKTGGDLNRAETEADQRRAERRELQGRVGAASARLGRLLLLAPTADLQPVDPAVPLLLVPPENTLEQLVQIGLMNRPELAAHRSLVDAAYERVRQAQLGPLLPRLQLDYLGGTFGGGRNDFVGNFSARGDMNAQAYWELHNLGLGDAALFRQRRAQLEQEQYRLADVQAQVSAEVVEAAKVAGARFQTLESAQGAVREALELYRKLILTSFNMVGPRPQYDSLEPLLAIQSLNQARVRYLDEVIEFNRAQFRLFAAMGQPPECALATAAVQPVSVPAVPPPPQLPEPPKKIGER